jgi:parafibromin
LDGAISSYNASDFLGPSTKWIPIGEKKNAGGKREKEQRITHTFANDVTVEFLLVDDPRVLTSDHDWQRVVAVFAIGQPWQFKDWKWANPVDLFQNVLGVHLMLDNEKVSDNVRSWNCKLLKVNQFKRHLDSGAANMFWDMLQKFAILNKPWVFTNKSSVATKK